MVAGDREISLVVLALLPTVGILFILLGLAWVFHCVCRPHTHTLTHSHTINVLIGVVDAVDVVDSNTYCVLFICWS
jgi:hypothetical protein